MMTSLGDGRTLFDVLTSIQSIYDRAANHVLYLRLQWPSTSGVWQELAQLAEALSQGRNSFDAVLQKLTEMRKQGVHVSVDEPHLQPIRGIIDLLNESLLKPIERGPLNLGNAQPIGETFRNRTSDGFVSRRRRPSLKIVPSGSHTGNPIRDTPALVQIATDSQKKVFAVIITFLEQPHRKLSVHDRQSLTTPLSRAIQPTSLSRNNTKSHASSSIFASPREQLEARMAPKLLSHARVASLQSTTPISPTTNNQFDFKRPLSSEFIAPRSEMTTLTEGGHANDLEPRGIIFTNPFEHVPEHAPNLASMPITELEIDPLLFRKQSVPAPPEDEVQSPLDLPIPRKKRPVGLPFLQQLRASGESPSKTDCGTASTSVVAAGDEPAVPHFLSSPLSDGPMPHIPPTPSHLSTSIGQENACGPAEDNQTQTLFSGMRTHLDHLSPFSAPERESADSYFTCEADQPDLRGLPAETDLIQRRPLSPRKDSVISRGSTASVHSFSSGKIRANLLPFKTLSRFANPTVVPPSLSPDLRSSTSSPPNSSHGLTQSAKLSAPSSLPSPDLTRASTDSAPPIRPHMPRMWSGPATASLPSNSESAGTPPRVNARKVVLSMSSPINESDDSLLQPSAWNDHLGFCVGAALAQMNKSGAMIQTRTVQADMLSHTVINFLKCSNSKCAFQGHGGADKVWESSGVQYRRDFLVKSHCKQKKARTSIYAFQCIFCILDRQKSPIIQGTDSFMAHVATHRDQKFSSAILTRTKCIIGRTAAPEEEFDVNLTPHKGPGITTTSMTPKPELATFFSSLEPDRPLHKPVSR